MFTLIGSKSKELKLEFFFPHDQIENLLPNWLNTWISKPNHT